MSTSGQPDSASWKRKNTRDTPLKQTQTNQHTLDFSTPTLLPCFDFETKLYIVGPLEQESHSLLKVETEPQLDNILHLQSRCFTFGLPGVLTKAFLRPRIFSRSQTRCSRGRTSNLQQNYFSWMFSPPPRFLSCRLWRHRSPLSGLFIPPCWAPLEKTGRWTSAHGNRVPPGAEEAPSPPPPSHRPP